MKILADQNMPLVEQYFADFGGVERFDGRKLTPEQLVDVDVLLTRSVTRVNHELLAQANKLSFVGTATIGIDHIDTQLLNNKNIAFSSAPGCNAIAVAEYVISSLFALSQENARPLSGQTIGIVGVGNIGNCLAQKLKALNVDVILCDPIKYEQGLLENHVTLDELLAQSDIVTFHVPLVKSGEHKTLHMMNKARLKALKPGLTLINASRGDVIDNQALLEVMQAGADLDLVLDVWEKEPNILTELLEHVRYASVHIAGHTLEGKARGTQMLYQKLCELKSVEASKSLDDFLPLPVITNATITQHFNEQDIARLVHLIYDVRRDDGILLRHLENDGFDSLRKNYPIRREFSTLSLQGESPQLAALSQLGFTIAK
ncbi:4-phosphoerythronate dehydrogenase [Pseudoalteromonas sp. SG45-5]|uniref:4-phosphoerythronate dehydrogenase n=1 Tax=unclassified Pseudoalteromonas TaxID=194690 RepID=UPI0015FB5F13|nr:MULTISPECIES: 4-phosphoerythronate dehydrogenase [unclassified Pseudoalteromonas]MBB1384015.1 4-phosphoerythronate dehydrogenase [Pseudoalteromonas sp. SG45-5]MBB1392434.1 4-phosphoerythronate dehydrogenase [Pseudoalteromonas sp. SG44-4]MBB1449141.1 4-phosphoerythronate dehydrogenase [Pseudoalteromonas sp. SG41-6]